jgi:large subunit ribosomal protein L27
MATKKGAGNTRNGRDSISKRLGLKKSGGEQVIAGNIIIRQNGTKYHAGSGVGIGKDYTLFAKRNGKVQFHKGFKKRQFVSVISRN